MGACWPGPFEKDKNIKWKKEDLVGGDVSNVVPRTKNNQGQYSYIGAQYLPRGVTLG